MRFGPQTPILGYITQVCLAMRLGNGYALMRVTGSQIALGTS